MESFLNLFFYADSLPQFFHTVGGSWGVRMACMCSVANFANLVLHVIIGGVLIGLLFAHRELMKDKFFLLLLMGIGFSAVSKFIDWWMNMQTATGTTVYWSNNLDLWVEGLQFIGMGIILYAIISKLFYVHHAGISSSSAS